MQKHRKPHPRRSTTQWRRIVDRWERSGQSASAFASKHQLSKTSLTWWRWRLRSGSNSPPRPRAGAELAFVPLVASTHPSSPPTTEARWVLETAAGVRVEMSGATSLVVDGLGIALERVRGKA